VALKAGAIAPDFGLLATPDQKVALSEFHRGPWSSFSIRRTGVRSAVTNSPYLAPRTDCFALETRSCWDFGRWSVVPPSFKEQRNVAFPLLADHNPKGEVARAYDVYRDGDGTSERALFVIDADRTVVWSEVSPVGVNPGADGALRAVEAMS